jgi:hypothetical protein
MQVHYWMAQYVSELLVQEEALIVDREIPLAASI